MLLFSSIRLKATFPWRIGRRTTLLLLLILTAALIILLSRYLFISEEQKVERVVKLAVRAVEREDLDTIAQLISDNYRGFYETTKQAALERARRDFERAEGLSIKIDELQVGLRGRVANVRVFFFASGYVTGGEVYDRVPFQGLAGRGERPDEARVRLVKEGEQWRLLEVEVEVP